MTYAAYQTHPKDSWTTEGVEKYLPLVKHIAGRLSISLPSHIEQDDLIGYGVFGLLDALERFEPSKGVKFETYATLRIRGAIIDGLRIMDWVPHSARQKVKKVQDAFYQLEVELGRAATTEEAARFLGIEMKELEGILAQAQVMSLTSIDETAATQDGDSSSALDFIHDPAAEEAFTEVENEERLKLLEQAIAKLPEKEQLVVALYYQEELTLKEIAAVLKLSESRISQLHSQAILRLRGRLSRQKKNLF